jgi:hypothetical protein
VYENSQNFGTKTYDFYGIKRLKAFGDWSLQQPEEMIIVGGHSLWFKSFFQVYIRTYAHMHIRTQTYSRTHTHTYIYKHMYTHTLAHSPLTHIHTYTHTHTYTLSNSNHFQTFLPHGVEHDAKNKKMTNR